MSRSTGWFGEPNGRGTYGSFTKVHLVVDGKPECGAQVAPTKEYQWCSQGIHRGYLECEHCRNIARRHYQGQLQ